MQRHLSGVATATALVLSLYACSSSDGAAGGDGDGGPDNGGEGGSSGSDAPSDPDGRADAATNPDGARDAAADGDAALDAPVDAGPPVVRFVGRFDMGAAGGPKTAYPAGRIIARFMGTEVKATFADAMLVNDYGANRWEVFIDGTSTNKIQLDRTQPTTFTLATGLPNGAHTVELYKLSEGSVGTSQFQGFDFSGGTLLPPPLPATRHMQFLGDSSSNGYGVDGAPGCSFTAATQNERRSYPALVAHDLLADHHNLSASGKGLFQNYARSDTDTFSVIYQRANVATYVGGVLAPLWSYADYTPDVVWITLGGNDYDKSGMATDPAPFDKFQAKYDELVTTVRTQHPSAHIFCAVAPSLSDLFPAGFNAYTSVKTGAQNVIAAHAADTKLYFFEFTRNVNGDNTACDLHVNAAKHRAMADEAILAIKAKTGW
ncbi:MAG TPA: SGNH/GDSL hydrolase family protein [Labilithrix sp.]|nr:SGNH/GDSL hydrolase family protein [Labilithrix sp.]